MAKVACFGEVLIRLSPPDGETFLAADRLNIFVGGAEANVGVGLVRLGHDVRMITALPDNQLGERALQTLRREGLDTSHIIHGPGRMGIYFVEGFGADDRGNTFYDRGKSAFAGCTAASFDFRSALEDVDLLVISGITPALGVGLTDAVISLADEAKARAIPVAFDCNYRPNLWAETERIPSEVIGPIVELSDILFANHLDAAYLTGFEGDEQDAAVNSMLERYNRLRIVIATRRTPLDGGGIAVLATAGRFEGSIEAGPVIIRNHIGRIGSGDAFVAGVLHGLLGGLEDKKTLAFGLAAMQAKHCTEGDLPAFGPDDLDALEGKHLA